MESWSWSSTPRILRATRSLYCTSGRRSHRYSLNNQSSENEGRERMPKFAANLSMMFSELDEPARFEAARKAGFTAVEYLRPYSHPVAEVRRWLDDAGLEMILINTLS